MRTVLAIVLTAGALAVIAFRLRAPASAVPAPAVPAPPGESPGPSLARVEVGPSTDDFPDVLALGLLFHEWSLRTRGTSSPLPNSVLGLEHSHEVYLWARSHLAVVLTFRNSREIVEILARIEKK